MFGKMRSIFVVIPTLFFLTALITGCPMSTSYPLGISGDVEIDARLLGTWKNDSGSVEVREALVRKANRYEYKIRVVEKGPRYEVKTVNYRAWLTKINDNQFLVLQEIVRRRPQPKYYVYHIEIGDQSVSTHDISLKVGGKAAVTSTETYRKEVEASMAMEGFLSNEIVWRKE